jgi:hypothetical protein
VNGYADGTIERIEARQRKRHPRRFLDGDELRAIRQAQRYEQLTAEPPLPRWRLVYPGLTGSYKKHRRGPGFKRRRR